MLQLVKKRKNSSFQARIYEGYGYRVSVEVFDEDMKTMTIKPIDDPLKQPEISVLENKAYACFDDVVGVFNSENIDTFVQYIQGARDLMKELDERFNEL